MQLLRRSPIVTCGVPQAVSSQQGRHSPRAAAGRGRELPVWIPGLEPRVLPNTLRPCVAMATLLLVLLLLGLAPGLARPPEPCPGPCRCRGRRLDCSGRALARVPPATRQRPFSVL